MRVVIVVLSILLGLEVAANEWRDPNTGIYWQYALLPGSKAMLGSQLGARAIGQSFHGDLPIPSTIDGYAVTQIGCMAFSSCYWINTVRIPASVTTIGAEAFYDCFGLTRVSLPESVVSIGDRAFYNCYTLAAVTMENHVRTIGEKAFFGCSRLESVTIPGSVYKIGAYAFGDCSKLHAVTMSDNFISIGKNAFGGCTSLSVVYVQPGSDVDRLRSRIAESGFDVSGVEFILLKKKCQVVFDANGGQCGETCRDYEEGDLLGELPIPSREDYSFVGWSTESFRDSLVTGQTMVSSELLLYARWIISADLFTVTGGKLTKYEGKQGNVTIPDGVGEIGESAFAGCTKLTSVAIPSSVTNIRYRAFYNCTSLTSVSLPTKLVLISDAAFENCIALTSMEIPSGVLSVGSAFRGCSGLVAITLPNSSAKGALFDGCTGLRSVTVAADVYMWNVFKDAYQMITNIVVCDGATSCPRCQYCKALESVTIPEGITRIGNNTFEDCWRLKRVTLPNSVTWIGEKAFYRCSDLESVLLPTNLSNIGAYAFSGCNSIKEAAIPRNIDRLYKLFPDSYETIESISVSEGNTICGYYMFDGCKGLMSVSLPSSTKTITEYAFNNCPKLERIIIPSSVTEIEDGAFKGCSGLRSIVMPVMPQWTLLSDAFPDSYQRVTDLEFCENAVKKIQSRFCENCSSLETVTVPASVTEIGWLAFSGCDKLTNIVLKGDAPKVDSWGFGCVGDGCTATVYAGTKGWDVDGDGLWQGLRLVYLWNNPLPDIGNSPSASDVATAVEGMSDSQVAVMINETNYNDFRDWVERVKEGSGNFAGVHIMEAQNAWLSYALGQDTLLEVAPTDADLSVETFEAAVESGKFDFTVSVKDIEIGSDAAKENLKKVFGLEGAATLDDAAFSSDKVDIEFGTPVDGKVKFTAGPKDTSSGSFFMKVKMLP